MITNKIEFTKEVIEENKDLIYGILELMEINYDIKVEYLDDIIITEEGNDILRVEVDGFEFITSDNYTSLEKEAVRQTVDILEECGLTENLIFEAELKGWIDTNYFEELWDELHYQMSCDGIQYIATDEEMELLESGQITEEEIRDSYYNSLQDSIKGNELDEYKYQFGEEAFRDTILENNLIDLEKLAEWCVDMDGVAHTLATYDGEEEEFNGFYFFRTN